MKDRCRHEVTRQSSHETGKLLLFLQRRPVPLHVTDPLLDPARLLRQRFVARTHDGVELLDIPPCVNLPRHEGSEEENDGQGCLR